MLQGFRNDRPLGYFQFSCAAATAVPSLPVDAVVALITVEGQAVRWRDDGTNPTPSVGYPLAVGAELEYTGQLNKLKFIEQTGGASVSICYYGFPL